MNDPMIESADTVTGDPTKRTLSIKRSVEALELRERLQKVLATSGLGARRGMEERILKGEITLNGAVPELGAQVKVGDRIGVDDRTFVVKLQEGDFGRILLYNKPDGEVTTRHDPEGRKTVFENLPRLRGSRWIAVGRLDINTQGLLIFTTNGDLAQKLTHPEFEFEREYLCRVHGEVTEEIVAQLLAGVELGDGPAAVSLIESMDSAGGSNEWWRVVITEGRNREIRRLWEAVGLQVSRLKRASFGPFSLPKGLHRGELTEMEPEDAQKMCIELGIGQNPSQLIAEDEGASRLRRNRVGADGAPEGKKRFVAAGKGKAEAFWTGERGYGGAGSRPMRAGGGEFDLGMAGSERPRDPRPKRSFGKPGAGGKRAAFVGPMGMSSFESSTQAPDARGPRSARPSRPGPGKGAGAKAGPRNDRRGQRRAPVQPGGEGLAAGENTGRFAPRARPEGAPARGPRQTSERSFGERGSERGGERGNRAGSGPRVGAPAHSNSEDFGNRIGGAQPRPARVPAFERRGARPARVFSGPMDNAYPSSFENRPEIDGNSVQRQRDPNFQPRSERGPRDPSFQPRGARGPRDPNAAPRAPRDPNFQPRGERGPRDPNAAPRAPRDPNVQPRGERGPRPPNAPRDANANTNASAPDGQRPNNRNRRRRSGPRPGPSTPGSNAPGDGNS
jgi:23S rRNA pseudouridine2605 synthase